MRIGWHYTTATYWAAIQATGAVTPYNLWHAAFVDCGLRLPVRGVWIWRRRLTPLEHFGAVIYQVSVKAEIDVVRLTVRYDPATRLRGPEGELVDVSHNGNVGQLQHHVRTPSVVVTAPIPLHDVVAVHHYPVTALVRRGRRASGR